MFQNIQVRAYVVIINVSMTEQKRLREVQPGRWHEVWHSDERYRPYLLPPRWLINNRNEPVSVSINSTRSTVIDPAVGLWNNSGTPSHVEDMWVQTQTRFFLYILFILLYKLLFYIWSFFFFTAKLWKLKVRKCCMNKWILMK